MNSKTKVYVSTAEDAEYVSDEAFWSPSEHYPEYPYEEVSFQENPAYTLIRNGFVALGMDAAHFGGADWNPLGQIIHPGMTVLLKPNWVLHKNDDISHDMSCVVTHPSVIRAALDYVLIALKGTGRVIAGDAPIQLCDFDKLQDEMGYRKLWEYYREKGIDIEVMDLRGMVAVKSSSGMKTLRDDMTGVVVDIGADSMFYGQDEKKISKMRITNYATHLLQAHHVGQKHEYMLHPIVLEADVIINLPKPKSHRKAGLTACAKNFVGANMRKEFLPHHTQGAKANGGDEYRNTSILHSTESHCLDRVNNSTGKAPYYLHYALYALIHTVRKAFCLTDKDYSEGSWYGNDTIWRTIVDLNRMVLYADRKGFLQKQQQRTVFNICDMIVAGEKEGPMCPSPKRLGMIVMGNSIWATDRVICRIAGFDSRAVKYLDYLPEKDRDDAEIWVCNIGKEPIAFDKYYYNPGWYFQPTSGWKGHIEVDVKH